MARIIVVELFLLFGVFILFLFVGICKETKEDYKEKGRPLTFWDIVVLFLLLLFSLVVIVTCLLTLKTYWNQGVRAMQLFVMAGLLFLLYLFVGKIRVDLVENSRDKEQLFKVDRK